MKLLLKILGGVGVLLLVLVIVAFFLPRSYKVERSVVIKAAPKTVWAMVVDLRAWREWSVWYRQDPEMTVAYSAEPTDSVGGWVEWQSAKLGRGRMTLQQVHAPAHLSYELSMPDWGSKSVGEVLITPTADGLRVTWSDAGDLGNNPLMRWFGLVFDGMIGPDFEMGLNNLKERAESPAAL